MRNLQSFYGCTGKIGKPNDGGTPWQCCATSFPDYHSQELDLHSNGTRQISLGR